MRKFYRINQWINAPQVRLITQEGKQVGIIPREKALELAREQGLDLVEIAPMAKPVVCRIIDFKKFKYLQSKKEREAKKHGHAGQIKEVRMGPFISNHDLETRLEHIGEFLKEGNRVKVTIRFTGRQMAHPEFGHKLLNEIKEKLTGLATLENQAKFEGRHLIGFFGPEKHHGINYEIKNKKISRQKI